MEGELVVGIANSNLVVRVSESDLEIGLVEGTFMPLEFAVTPCCNMAKVVAGAWSNDAQLQSWVSKSLEFVRLRLQARSLEAKPRA